MDSDGGNPVRLTNDAANDGDPVWSPDGSQIAFMSARDGDYEVFVMPSVGGDATQLTEDTTDQYGVDWLPIVAETVAGDADCNTVVNLDDGIAVLKFLDGIVPAPACVFQGNLFCHDSLRARDVLLLFQYLAGFDLDLGDCPQPGDTL
jgi:dipeptidyl aminopeptidase/acylaminoacyl peptidase